MDSDIDEESDFDNHNGDTGCIVEFTEHFGSSDDEISNFIYF